MPPRKKSPSDQYQITPRQTKILFALVKEYCEVGITCGSLELQQKYGFEFSSATIRNEMASLRENGYLYQPFINSSSCPTEKAFKLFVNQLIAGLTVATKQQQEMKAQILSLQERQENMNKEIAKLISTQTDSLGFSLSAKSENINGIKHLLSGQSDQTPVSEVLEFLDNLDKYKHHLLLENNPTPKGKKAKIQTIFGSENNVLPLGKGYALVATEVMVGNEKTVVGIISPTHLLANQKKLSTLEAISKVFGDQEE
jgi:transcriptional regulator of heat shock response